VDYADPAVGILVTTTAPRVLCKIDMWNATFMQKVFICAFLGFLAASLIEWGKVFVEGADDALNKGYKHHSVMGDTKP
jgi:hypothetical protein